MTCIQSLLKVVAFCALNASLLHSARAQLVVVVPEDPACRATPDMVYAGLMAVTDPACLATTQEPGCNLFGIPDCRACALMPEGTSTEAPSCELLDVFKQESEAFGSDPVSPEDCNCEPQVPPPLVPATPVEPHDPVETTDSTEASEEEDYAPIVIVLPTDIFIEAESSVWADSEGSSEPGDESEAGDEEDEPNVYRRLRTQL
ncbi:unnamed protein product [Phytophthora lilii]|uniref:Unnamed protein product n=1 Tax=Phytophthora lilii TaxID=2077276 RepID=A0A9W6TZT4_9STRA|nr:unnamed protein product [Phytophthora lilii]